MYVCVYFYVVSLYVLICSTFMGYLLNKNFRTNQSEKINSEKYRQENKQAKIDREMNKAEYKQGYFFPL